jgi:hypothetical protein
LVSAFRLATAKKIGDASRYGEDDLCQKVATAWSIGLAPILWSPIHAVANSAPPLTDTRFLLLHYSVYHDAMQNIPESFQ